MIPSITPLYFGKFKDFEKSRFTLSKDAGLLIDVAVLAYLVRDGERLILVDSGTPEPVLAAKMDCREIFEARSMLDVLAAQNLAPQDIHEVVLTHLHWDHAFNLNHFQHATIYVQESELHYAVNPLWLCRVPYGYSKQNGAPCWFAGFHQMKVMRGDYILSDAISVYHLPGHTPGMQGVLVNTRKGRYMIASDNFPLYDSYESVLPPAVHVSLRDWHDSYLKTKSLCDFILPGHDMKVLKQKSYGTSE